MYPGVWRQGDWVRFSAEGTCIVTGRSDATLNRGGVRMGTSELYAVVEEFDEVADSLIVHLEDDEGGPGELVLFVVADLDDDLRSRLAGALRTQLSPRHVPDTIAAVQAIPRTLTGKKLEAPVKRILRGAAPESVVSRGALADPAAIDAFVQFSEGRADMTIVQPALAPPRIVTDHAPDGSLILRSEMPLEPYEASLGVLLRRWGTEAPDRVFLAERDGDGDWVNLTWGDANRKASAIAQALLDRGLGPQRPLLLLSGNAIDHALLTLGGFLAGVPVVPVSPAYSLMSQDYGKVKHIAALVKPGLVYAADAGPFGGVLAAVDFGGRRDRALQGHRRDRVLRAAGRPRRRRRSTRR